MSTSKLYNLQKAFARVMMEFVSEASVGLAVLINRRGQVLAQYGVEDLPGLNEVAALAAAINASGRSLAIQLGYETFKHTLHLGERRQLLVGTFECPAGQVCVLAVFDHRSSVGLIRLVYGRLVEHAQELSATEAETHRELSAENFEQGLRHSLDKFFLEDLAEE